MPKILTRIFNNPLSALIIAGAILAVMWIASLFPADYKLGQFLQFAGTSTFMVALMLVFVWLVWRVRTTYHSAKGTPDALSSDAKALLRAVAYLSVSIVMLAAAILSHS